MKDGLISKLIIIETRHRPIQYKNVIDILPVSYEDKNYKGLNDVIWNGIDLVESEFHTALSRQKPMIYRSPCIIITVNSTKAVAGYCSRTPTITMARQTHVFDLNLQKELLSEDKWNSKRKSQKFS